MILPGRQWIDMDGNPIQAHGGGVFEHVAGNLGAGGRTNYTESGVMWQTIIHTVFILSAIGIAYVERISSASEQATLTAKHGRH